MQDSSMLWKLSRRGGGFGSGREASYFYILALGLAALLLMGVAAITTATEPVILMWANPL